MKIKVLINSRGNGACPICTHEKVCVIRDSFKNALATVYSPTEEQLELAIFKCPRFEEKG